MSISFPPHRSKEFCLTAKDDFDLPFLHISLVDTMKKSNHLHCRIPSLLKLTVKVSFGQSSMQARRIFFLST